MIQEDPVVTIHDLLSSNWDASNTPLASNPSIHTGWYDFGSSDPQVTITTPDEFTTGGGDTGHSAGTGSGGVAQVRAGTVQVDCWAGTREDLEGAGAGGSDVNPKDASYQMAREVHRIMQEHAGGASSELNSLGADDIRRLVDTDRTPVVYRHEVTVRYTYVTHT